jgi:hypothetical protein
VYQIQNFGRDQLSSSQECILQIVKMLESAEHKSIKKKNNESYTGYKLTNKVKGHL